MTAADADPRVADHANTQHGLITTRQLQAIGLSAAAISERVHRGHLHRLHRGVYAVGHRVLTPHGRMLAALLACPPGAVFSHRTAAGLHGLLATRAGARLDVLVPAPTVRARGDAIKLRLTRQLPHQDRTLAHELPVTSVARTLLDLAGTEDDWTLRRAFHESEVQRTLDVRRIEEVLGRLGNRPGAALLRELIAAPPETTEHFVELFLALCDDHDVKRPAVDVRIDTGRRALGQADLVYIDERVIVELDGAQTHMTRRRFEEDRRRDSYLSARGWLTLRYTWRRVTQDAPGVARELRATLALRAGTVMR